MSNLMYIINSSTYHLTDTKPTIKRNLMFWTYRNNNNPSTLEMIYKYHNARVLKGNLELIKDLVSKNCIDYDYVWSAQDEKDLYEETERAQSGLKMGAKGSKNNFD